jgi:hypothetical protein
MKSPKCRAVNTEKGCGQSSRLWSVLGSAWCCGDKHGVTSGAVVLIAVATVSTRAAVLRPRVRVPAGASHFNFTASGPNGDSPSKEDGEGV